MTWPGVGQSRRVLGLSGFSLASAGLATGFWRSELELKTQLKIERRFQPGMETSRREELCEGWRRAVGRAKGWVTQ